jgi:hypothetical protein
MLAMTCDRSASGCRDVVPARSLRWAASAVVLGLLVPVTGTAQTSWRYDQDVRLSYEFDDNVEEQPDDPVHAQVARLEYTGDMLWGGGEQQLKILYNGGFKQHFGSVQRELDVSSQFVNEGTVAYLRKVTPRLAVGGELGFKHRAWTSDRFFFINEDGFLRRRGGLRAVVDLEPLDADHSARLQFGVDWVDEEFKNLDGIFGNQVVGGNVSMTKEFGEDVEATASYAFDRVRYPGLRVLDPGDNPLNILSPLGERQEDHTHNLGAVVSWFGDDVSLEGEYHFRYNDSNSFGFRYLSHSIGIQVLVPLPWDMLAQALAQAELRSFLEPVPSVSAGSLDTGDAQNNVLLLRLVKDIAEDYSLEARYARYRNEAITLNDFYTKNIWSFGVIYRP